MNREEVLKKIDHFLSDQYQMVIATHGTHPWIATVYFSYDAEFNFYFLSDPDTLHCQQIAQNPEVAITVAQSPQVPASKKKGLQLWGTAEKISNTKKIAHALDLWRQTLGVTSSLYTVESMTKKLIKGRMYKVTPQMMKLFAQEIWEEGEEPVVKFSAQGGSAPTSRG